MTATMIHKEGLDATRASQYEWSSYRETAELLLVLEPKLYQLGETHEDAVDAVLEAVWRLIKIAAPELKAGRTWKLTSDWMRYAHPVLEIISPDDVRSTQGTHTPCSNGPWA